MARIRKDFAMVPARAIKELDAGTLNVYTALCLRADGKTGECYPSYARIAQDTNLSRSTVQRSIQTLTALGWITKRRKGSNLTHKANLYHVNNAPQAVNTTTGEILDRFTHEPSLGSPVAKAVVTREPLTNHQQTIEQTNLSINSVDGGVSSEQVAKSEVSPTKADFTVCKDCGEDSDFCDCAF